MEPITLLSKKQIIFDVYSVNSDIHRDFVKCPCFVCRPPVYEVGLVVWSQMAGFGGSVLHSEVLNSRPRGNGHLSIPDISYFSFTPATHFSFHCDLRKPRDCVFCFLLL
jgi:hypothetical protein